MTKTLLALPDFTLQLLQYLYCEWVYIITMGLIKSKYFSTDTSNCMKCFIKTCAFSFKYTVHILTVYSKDISILFINIRASIIPRRIFSYFGSICVIVIVKIFIRIIISFILGFTIFLFIILVTCRRYPIETSSTWRYDGQAVTPLGGLTMVFWGYLTGGLLFISATCV